jgi:hypothetical protein
MCRPRSPRAGTLQGIDIIPQAICSWHWPCLTESVRCSSESGQEPAVRLLSVSLNSFASLELSIHIMGIGNVGAVGYSRLLILFRLFLAYCLVAKM